MARPPAALASRVTTHCPGPPWPVSPKSKSAGTAPTSIFSIGIMVMPFCASTAEPAHAMAHAATEAAKHILFARKIESLSSSIRTPLDTSSVAQSLDGTLRLKGSLHPHVVNHRLLY